MKRLLGSLITVGLLLLMAALWLTQSEFAFLKPHVESYVSQLLGRTLNIQGDFSVRLGRSIEINAKQISLENAPWAGSGSEPMLEVESFSLSVALSSLVQRPVVVQRLDIQQVQALLLRHEQHGANWSLLGNTTSPAAPAPEQAEPTAKAKHQSQSSFSPIPVLLKKMNIRDVQIHYQSPNLRQSQHLYIEQLEQRLTAEQQLMLKLDANWNNKPIVLRGEVDSWQKLLNGQDFRYQLDGHWSNSGFEIAGYIDDVRAPQRPEIEFALNSEGAAFLVDFLGIDSVLAGRTLLKGYIRAEAEHLLVHLDGNWGQAELSVHGVLAALEPRQPLQLALRLSGSDAAHLLQVLSQHYLPEYAALAETLDAVDLDVEFAAKQQNDLPSYTLKIRSDRFSLKQKIPPTAQATPAGEAKTVQRKRLFSEVPLPFAHLKKINLSLDAQLKQLSWGPLLARGIQLEAELNQGHLQLHQLNVQGTSGQLQAKAELQTQLQEATNEIAILSTRAKAQNFSLVRTPAEANIPFQMNMELELASQGRSVQALMAQLSGNILFDSRGGRIANNHTLQAVYGNLLEKIIKTINPYVAQETHTQLNCVVLPWRFGKGRWKTREESLISTEHLNIVAHTEVNLDNEKLNVEVWTSPANQFGVSAGELLNPYIKIEGKLAQPRLAIDETGALLSSGAAVATSGLSIVAKGIWDRARLGRSPCEKFSKAARKKMRGKFSDF